MCDNQGGGDEDLYPETMQKLEKMKINEYLERHEFPNPHKLSSIVIMHKIQLIK